MLSTTVTGIPIEYLFLSIGSLVSGFYALIVHELREIKRNGEQRDRKLDRVQTAVVFICAKLNIEVPPHD